MLAARFQPLSHFRDDIAEETVQMLTSMRDALRLDAGASENYALQPADIAIYAHLTDGQIEAFEDGLFPVFSLAGGARWLLDAADATRVAPSPFYERNHDALILRHTAARAAPEHARFAFCLDAESVEVLVQLSPAKMRAIAHYPRSLLVPQRQITAPILRALATVAVDRYRSVLVCALSPLARHRDVPLLLHGAVCGDAFFKALTGLRSTATREHIDLNGPLLDFVERAMRVTTRGETISYFFGREHADEISALLRRYRRAHNIDGRGTVLKDGALALRSMAQRVQASFAVGVTLAIMEAGGALPIALLSAWRYTAQTFGLPPRGLDAMGQAPTVAHARNHLTFDRLVAVIEAIKHGNVVADSCAECGVPTLRAADARAECPVCRHSQTGNLFSKANGDGGT